MGKENTLKNTRLFEKIEHLKTKITEKKDFINSKVSLVFILYFLFNFSLYFLEGVPGISSFIGSTAGSLLVKFISYFILFGYSFVFLIANKCALNRNGILLILILLFNGLISTLFFPASFSVVNINNFGHRLLITYSYGVLNNLIGYLTLIFDMLFFLFFCFLFRQQIKLKDIKAFLVFIVLFTFAEFIYSLIFETSSFANVFNGLYADAGEGTGLHGTFVSKNGLGFLLFQGIAASWGLVLLYKKKIFIPFVALFHIYSFLSLCRTTFLSSIILDVILYICLVVYCYKKSFKKFVVALLPIIICGNIFGLSFIEGLNSNEPFKFINKAFISLFHESGKGSFIADRNDIWNYGITLVRGPYGFFGYGTQRCADILYIASGFTTHTFHNIYINIIGSFGIFGLFVFIYSIVYVVNHAIYKNTNLAKKFFVLSLLVGSLVYGFFENTIIILGSSCTLFTSSVVLACSPDECNEKYNQVLNDDFKNIEKSVIEIIHGYKENKSLIRKVLFFIDIAIFAISVVVFMITSIDFNPTTKVLFIVVISISYSFKIGHSLFLVFTESANKKLVNFYTLLFIIEIMILEAINLLSSLIFINNTSYLTNTDFTFAYSTISVVYFMCGCLLINFIVIKNENN